MAKGIVAFMIVVILTLSMSILSGMGFYSELGVSYNEDMDADTQSAAEAMIGQEATDRGSGSVLQEFTTSGGQTLSSAWQVIANLSGVLKLLFGVPDALASGLQIFFQITFSVTFAAFIRGVVVQ